MTSADKEESKKSLDKAFQLLQIVQFIPERSYITCQELRLKLEDAGIHLSTRTLQRHLEALADSELFDIDCNSTGKPFGYKRHSRLTDLGVDRLKPQDALLLRLAELHLNYQMPSNLTNGLSPIFEQARTYFNGTVNGKEKKWLEKVAVVGNSLPFDAPKIRKPVLDDITRAIFEELMIEIDYFSGSKQEKKRHLVHPLGIVQQDVRIYLVCRFDGHDDIRSVAINRIEAVKMTGFRTQRPKDFVLKNYVKRESVFNYDHGQWIRLSFNFTSPVTYTVLSETPFSGKGQTITERKDAPGWHLEATVLDSRLLDGWLAMWTKDAGITDIERIPLTD